MNVIVRHNLRLAANVGSDDLMNWVGDFLCVWCCGLCSAAQMLRTTDKADWDSIGDLMANGVRVYVEPFKMVKA